MRLGPPMSEVPLWFAHRRAHGRIRLEVRRIRQMRLQTELADWTEPTVLDDDRQTRRIGFRRVQPVLS